jgi:mRNA-degrading endonuclease toxin of MazEF toxin-antitoxin module
MKPRAIWLADFSKTETGDEKLRPVLIVSASAFNGGGDVVTLPMSHSADISDPHVVSVTIEEFPQTGLAKLPSSIRWTKPTTLPKTLLRKKLGVVSQRTLDVVRKKLKSMFTG